MWKQLQKTHLNLYKKGANFKMWRKISFKAKFFKEEDVYVSLCPELNL